MKHPHTHGLGLSELVADFFEHGLSQAEGFEVRPSQQEMAQAVAETLLDGGRLAVEAQTGTGKSLAYLIPLLLGELPEGGKAVIATKTLQLQEQLMTKELPFLQSRLATPRRVVQARGWSNYLCLRKVETPSEESVRALGSELPRLRNLAQARGGRLTRGEVSTTAAVWGRLHADPVDCSKNQCPHFSRCGLFAERRELDTAEIILTNHAFLLSDLKVRRDGGSLLPACQTLVLDEAHRFDDTATDQLTIRLDAERLHSCLTAPRQGWLEALRFALLTQLPEAHLLQWSSDFDLHVVLAMQELETLGTELLGELATLASSFPGIASVSHALLHSPAGEQLAHLASEFSLGMEGLVDRLLALGSQHAQLCDGEPPAELERLARGLHNFASDLDFLLAGNDDDWVFLCHFHPAALLARPVDNSITLHNELFSAFSSVVATSATLTINDSFDFFFQRTGFSLQPARQLKLPSPFDAARASFIGLANSGPTPNDPDYLHDLAPSLCRLASGLGGRTFILTTSHRSLILLAELLNEPLQLAGVDLLVQGDAPPGQLLQRFRTPGAHVLLGVDTFWEGVDISGERLSCVVLTRIPFPVPNDPLFQARSQRIENSGGNAFDELSLPLAGLKLKQGFGRLLRSAGDRGVFLLLDPRVGAKRYGRSLARQLPGDHAHWGPSGDLVEQALAWAHDNLDSAQELGATFVPNREFC